MENHTNSSSSNAKIYTCIWVIPKKKQVVPILKIKNELNKSLRGPNFPIHMTLVGDPSLSYLELKGLISEFSNSIPEFKITYSGFGMKDMFFQAFYVDVILNQPLKSIRSKIYKILKKKNQAFMPHLSLYYGKKNIKTKKILLDGLPLTEGSFLVDSLYIVSFDSLNIEWKVLNKINLNRQKDFFP